MVVDKVKKSIVNKAYLMYGLFLLAMIIIVLRVVLLICKGKEFYEKESASMAYKSVEASRGDIISSDGRILASSAISYELRWDLRTKFLSEKSFFENNVDTLAICMSNLFGDNTAQWYADEFRKAFQAKKPYYLIKRNVSRMQLMKLRKFPIFNRGRYKSGLVTENKYTRNVPHGNLAYRTIGYLNQEEALVGIEKAYDDILKGKDGVKYMYKIGGGEWVPFDVDGNIEPQDGYDVVSTINMEIQDIADQSLRRIMTKSGAKFGTAIVMEVATGKVRAMVNLDYDTSSNSYIEKYNHAMATRLPPGSTFKLASLVAILEKTGMSIHDSIKVPGTEYWPIGRKKPIKDDHSLQGYRTISEIFEHSSNVGVAQLVRSVFPEHSSEVDFTQRIQKMRLAKKTDFDLIGEAEPLFRVAGDPMWSKGSLEMVSIGYETEFTPLQILNFYNAIANNGVMMKPKIVEAVRWHGVDVKTYEPEVLDRMICSEETVHKAQQLLEGVVLRGTAREALKKCLCSAAGKTGTAQKMRNGEVRGHSASFAGYFPADHPKYSCIVVVNSPSTYSVYGSALAAPVFGDIASSVYARDRETHSGRDFDIANMETRTELPIAKSGDIAMLDWLYSTFNIERENVDNAQSQFVSVSNKNGVAELESIPIKKASVPDVVGMGLRDAMYLLRKNNLNVKVVGRGTVKKQSLQPYSEIKGNKTITIELGI
ncbi:MAG: transpeptidase family protein [Bacteroidales bacterium]|nr:transpeptidase family protein [Bacteroidales bacterium]